MRPSASKPKSAERLAAEIFGRRSETLAAWYLRLKGFYALQESLIMVLIHSRSFPCVGKKILGLREALPLPGQAPRSCSAPPLGGGGGGYPGPALRAACAWRTGGTHANRPQRAT